MDNQSKELFGQTPWQTVGPFFHYGLPWKGGADLVGASEIGARDDLFAPEHYLLRTPLPRRPIDGPVIEISGRVLDGEGEPVPDALVEIWQADANGHYYDPDINSAFIGFGRAATADDGAYCFRTLFPGRVAGPGNSLQASHIAVGVMARGLLRRLVTRLYLPDSDGLEDDPILALVPPDRRATLIAKRQGGGYRFDIILQGSNETVFFDC